MIGVLGVGVLLFAVLLVVAVAGSSRSDRENQRYANERQQRILDEFHPDALFVSSTAAVAIRFADQKVLLGEHHGEEVYDFRDLLAVEVRSSETVLSETQTDRGSQVVGALVGGAVGGGIGAAVGALTARQDTEATADKTPTHLVVFVQSRERPHYIIDLTGAWQQLPTIQGHLLGAMRHASGGDLPRKAKAQRRRTPT